MKFILSTLILLFSCDAWAQKSLENFIPPVTEKGEKFKSISGKNRQHTDVEYLHPDQKLDVPVVSKPDRTEREGRKLTAAEIDARNQLAKTFAIVVLIIIAIVIFLIWLNNRMNGSLFAWLGRKDRFVEPDAGNKGPLADAAVAPPRSLEELSTIVDPEKGLHDLLVQALLRAAEQNNIPLRRSLTTRDVLQQIPTSWPNRDVLNALANRCELVFFGGRAIDQEGYQQALSLAQPLFSKRRQ